ncbi:hypothetical protein ACFY2M_26270 [Streptomyces sp. NPDC001276]
MPALLCLRIGVGGAELDSGEGIESGIDDEAFFFGGGELATVA